MLIRADRFAVVNGAASSVPFIVDSGVVYLKSAMIKAASITSLEIAGNAITVPVRTFDPAIVDIVSDADWITVAVLKIRRRGMATEFTFSCTIDGFGNGAVDFILTRGASFTPIRSAGAAGALNGRQSQVSFSTIDWDTGTGMTTYRIRARKANPARTAGWNANMRVFRRYFSAIQFMR